jgi:hypothetical protein
MYASRFEFRHRTWFIFGIFCVGLACYCFDPQLSGVALVESSKELHETPFVNETAVPLLLLPDRG